MPSRPYAALLAATVFACFTSPLTAQPASPAPTDDAIVVTGVRPEDAPVRDASVAFVRAVLPLPRAGQYARWHVPICPKVNGLDDKLAGLVATRLRRTATEIGAEVAPEPCTPNVVIAFTLDAPAVAKRIVAKEPGQVRSLDQSETDLLLRSALPVRWWNATRIESADGRAATASSTALAGINNLPVGPDTVFVDTYSASLIDTKIRAATTNSTVLVDADLANGYRLDAMAAYIAMAVLSQSRMANHVDPKQSILGLFAPGQDPAARATTLTKWDRAFLVALYKAPVSRNGRAQRAAIATEMVKQIVGK